MVKSEEIQRLYRDDIMDMTREEVQQIVNDILVDKNLDNLFDLYIQSHNPMRSGRNIYWNDIQNKPDFFPPVAWTPPLITGNYTVASKVDNYTVQIDDFGISKVLTMDNAATKTFTLPSVDTSHIGLVLTFAKLGAGKLVIDAADSDTIGNSSAGGTVFDSVAGEVYATVTIMLASATKWTITRYHGSWVTT